MSGIPTDKSDFVGTDYDASTPLGNGTITAGQVQQADGKFVTMSEDGKVVAVEETTKDTKAVTTGDNLKADTKAAPVTADTKTADTKQEAKEAPEAGKPETYLTQETDEQLTARLTQAGGLYADERYRPFAMEFERMGDLTPERRAEAAAAFNVPANAIDVFIEGQKALRTVGAVQTKADTAAAEFAAQALLTEFHQVVGGAAEYAKFAKWANEGGVTEAEGASYSKLLDGDAQDKAAAKVLLGAFNERYKAAGNGAAPRDITKEAAGGTVTDAGKVVGYSSMAEQQRDQRSRKYAEDDSFRQHVMARIAASDF